MKNNAQFQAKTSDKLHNPAIFVQDLFQNSHTQKKKTKPTTMTLQLFVLHLCQWEFRSPNVIH